MQIRSRKAPPCNNMDAWHGQYKHTRGDDWITVTNKNDDPIAYISAWWACRGALTVLERTHGDDLDEGCHK